MTKEPQIMSTTPPNRRRDAVETSVLIERAAIDLVLEHGYEAVTVDMICELAGVSQRTFFNHFKTKDLALLGPGGPAIDQRAARAYVAAKGPLLQGAVELIHIEPGQMAADPTLLAARIHAVGTSPALVARQMERLSMIEEELEEIIQLRLRTQWPEEDASDLSAQAELITHLLAGVMRFIAMSWADDVRRGHEPKIDPGHVRSTLDSTIRKLGSERG
ncbi:TetR family transcriptional regulator [Microbacterium sp. ABRD28]|nr:TetR family transcriptional regulator [Microbacterium sp. ABRD28]